MAASFEDADRLDELFKKAQSLIGSLEESMKEWQKEEEEKQKRLDLPYTHLIRVEGTAVVYDESGQITDADTLRDLSGVSDQTDFVEYMHEESEAGKALQTGSMCFLFRDGQLWTVTEYRAFRELTEDELMEVEKYTIGQWSDGIGEGFEQKEVNGYYFSAWHWEQEPTIKTTQTKL